MVVSAFYRMGSSRYAAHLRYAESFPVITPPHGQAGVTGQPANAAAGGSVSYPRDVAISSGTSTTLPINIVSLKPKWHIYTTYIPVASVAWCSTTHK